MKKRVAVLFLAAVLGAVGMTGCGTGAGSKGKADTATTETDDDQAAADAVAAMIDAIYVQERTKETDKQCADAKAAWDAVTNAQ